MGLFSDTISIGKDLFGSESKVKGSESIFGQTDSTKNLLSKEYGTESEQLQLDPAAIQQIIEDVLSGPQGLASIFGGEQSSGLYNSSVSAQAAGDLASKLVGELAKITGKNVKTLDLTTDTEETASETKTQDGSTKTENKDKGLLGSLF